MNYYGLWNPNSNRYPTLEEKYKNGAFLVTQAGFFNGEKFKKGEWLIGIRDEEEESITWATASSVINFSGGSTDLDLPDAGFYTKIRLNDNGQIIDAGDLEEKDLPKHKHQASDVEGLKKALLEVVKDIFTDGMDSAVTFSVDEETGNITADVDIDENSLIKDENGNLAVNPKFLAEHSLGSENSGSEGSSIDSETLNQAIQEKVQEMLNNISIGDRLVFNSEGFKDETDPKTGIRTITVKLDQNTITLNENRELTIAPDLLARLSANEDITENNDYGHKCSSEVTLEDLKKVDGLQEWLFSQLSEIFEFDIEDYIDDETIVLDKNGKISAVSMKVQKHKHEISDINGLEERLTPAAQQPVSNAGDNNLDWTDGQINLEDVPIGIAIWYINKNLKETNNKIEELEKLIGKAQPAEPDHFSKASFEIKSNQNDIECYDLEKNRQTVQCKRGKLSLTLNEVYPFNSGIIEIKIDSTERSIDLKDFENVHDSIGGLVLTKIEDAYKDLAQFKGWYNSGNFEFEFEVSEGEHLVQVYFRDKADGPILKSQNTALRYCIPTVNPGLETVFETPKLNNKISGIPCSTETKVTGEIVWNNIFTERYLPTSRKVFVQKEEDPDKKELKPQLYTDKNILFESVVFDYDKDFEGEKVVTVFYSLEEGMFERNIKLKPFRFDDSEIEKTYRVSWSPKTDGEDLQWESWNSSKNLNSTDQISIIRGIAKNTFKNYSLFEGYDYSLRGSPKEQFVELLIPLTKSFKKLSHISFKLVNENQRPFEIDDFTGKYKDLNIWIGLVSNKNCLALMKGNKTYCYETLNSNSRNFGCLDLYHSSETVKTFTLGNQNNLENIDSVLLKIGLPADQSLDLNELIKTFKGV